MAFTTVSRTLSIDGKNWDIWGSQSPYLYPEDIAIIMSQSVIDEEGIKHPVVALQCILVKFWNEDDTEVLESLAMIGLWYDRKLDKYVRMDHGDALLALGCGRHNRIGANFMNRPRVKSNYDEITPKIIDGPDKYQFPDGSEYA